MEKANKEAFVFAFTYPDEETIRKNGGRALPTNREAAAEALKNWMKARYQVEALPWGLTVDWQEIAIRNYHAEDFGRKRASTIVTFGRYTEMVVQGKDLEKLDALMQANKEFKAKRAVQISVREQVRAIRQKFEAANGVNDFNGALQEPGFTVCDGKMQVFKNAIIHTQVTNDREQVRKNIEAAFERLAKWEALDGIDVEEYLK